jgi:hypothetical protein
VEVTTCHSLLLIASAGRGYLGSRRKERGLIPPTSSRPPRASPRDLEISAPRYNGDNHLTADRGTWIRGDTRAKPSPAVAKHPAPSHPCPCGSASANPRTNHRLCFVVRAQLPVDLEMAGCQVPGAFNKASFHLQISTDSGCRNTPTPQHNPWDQL